MWCVSGEGTIALLVKAVEWPTDSVCLWWLTSRCVLFLVILSLNATFWRRPRRLLSQAGPCFYPTEPFHMLSLLQGQRKYFWWRVWQESGNSWQGQDFPSTSLDCLSQVSCSPEQLCILLVLVALPTINACLKVIVCLSSDTIYRFSLVAVPRSSFGALPLYTCSFCMSLSLPRC